MTKEEQQEKFENVYYNKLGMCGCGSPNEVKNFLFNLLENHRKYKDSEISHELMIKSRKELINSVDSDIIFEIIFHVFENSSLLEHGGSVYGSWFTEKGKEFLKLLSKFKDEE
jgi:hypothetical protein